MSTEIKTTTPGEIPASLQLTASIAKQVAAIEAAAVDGMTAWGLDAGNIAKAFMLSNATLRLREALTDDIIQQVMILEGSPLGYRTDKDSKKNDNEKYPIATVRDCVVEALIRGARLTGNEMNIISSRAYFTKEFFERKVKELPGLTDLVIKEGVPVRSDTNALVPMFAEWKHNGKRKSLDCCLVKDGDTLVSDTRIPVRVNEGQIVDAIMGKAKRKMLARIYNVMTGSTLADDTEGDNVIDAAPAIPNKLDEVKKRLADKQAAAAGADGGARPTKPAGRGKPATTPGDTMSNAAAAEQKPEPTEKPEKQAEPKPPTVQEVFFMDLRAALEAAESRDAIYKLYEDAAGIMAEKNWPDEYIGKLETVVNPYLKKFPKS
jgi:hypothetical protein